MLRLVADISIQFGSRGTSWRDTATVAAAVSSPVVALVAALYATTRTLANDRAQRALDRQADREQQRHDRQLTAAADFADAAHRARVAIERADPAEAWLPQLSRQAEQAVGEARLQLARIQLLFKDAHDVPAAAEALADALASAERAAAGARAAAAAAAAATPPDDLAHLEVEGDARVKYGDEVKKARSEYERFVTAASEALAAALQA
jgi:hypothetical protein